MLQLPLNTLFSSLSENLSLVKNIQHTNKRKTLTGCNNSVAKGRLTSVICYLQVQVTYIYFIDLI